MLVHIYAQYIIAKGRAISETVELASEDICIAIIRLDWSDPSRWTVIPTV